MFTKNTDCKLFYWKYSVFTSACVLRTSPISSGHFVKQLCYFDFATIYIVEFDISTQVFLDKQETFTILA